MQDENFNHSWIWSFEYHENLLTQLIHSSKDKKEKNWSRNYYSDFETDTILPPHVPYLNCTVFKEGECIHKLCFYGVKSGANLLRFFENGSLSYLHNLKYDASFFINIPWWNTEITERSRTVLQIVMTKYIQKEWFDPKT